MINRELLSNILCVEYEVHLAENGKAALDILKAGDCSFSLILLDLLMPDMDGFDFIKKPYDMPDVILARCERIIELQEDKNIIHDTERDGLFTSSVGYSHKAKRT